MCRAITIICNRVLGMDPHALVCHVAWPEPDCSTCGGRGDGRGCRWGVGPPARQCHSSAYFSSLRKSFDLLQSIVGSSNCDEYGTLFGGPQLSATKRLIGCRSSKLGCRPAARQCLARQCKRFVHAKQVLIACTV